jgi:hypothetical protein
MKPPNILKRTHQEWKSERDESRRLHRANRVQRRRWALIGHTADINDIVGFQGESVDALQDAFAEAVADYLETCAKVGRTP